MQTSESIMSNSEYQKIWDRPIIRIGVCTMILASLTAFVPVLYICLSTGIWPTVSEFFQCWGLSAATWGALYFMEPITYYNVIGLSGTYVGFLTGNIGNMRVPCAAAALEATDIEPNTREGEIVSTLGITGSAITSIIFTTLAALVGVQLIAILPEPVIVAFDQYTIPAIFGAMVGSYVTKHPKLVIFSIALALLFIYVIKVPSYIAMLACVILTVVFARVLYNRERKADAQA